MKRTSFLWRSLFVMVLFLLICTCSVNAETGEMTVPMPSESTGETYLESEQCNIIMEASDMKPGYHHGVPSNISGYTEVYAKFTLPKRAEIGIDCGLGVCTGDKISYELLLADRKTVVASYTRLWSTTEKTLQNRLLYGVLPAGTYYLHLHNYIAWDCNSFNGLQFTTTYYDETDGIVTDESTEPNDTRDFAAKIEGTQSGYLSYFGDDPCDWYTFEVTKGGADFSLSMEREGCIEYKLYKKGQETPDYEGVIYGTHITHWQTNLDTELAEGSYDLCVIYKDHGADAEYSTYNTRGGLYDITVRAHDQASEEQPSDDQQDSGQASDELSDDEKTLNDAWDALEKSIDEAVKIEKGNYTDESYNALYEAVTAAYFLGLGQYVTTEELKAATARIEAAKDALAVKEEIDTEEPTSKVSSIKVGDTRKYKKNTYKVLSLKSKKVALTKAKNAKSVSVPETIKIKGKTYKVTQIDANAFKAKKIRTVTIGKNVKVIKKNAFKGSKATKIVLKTKLLKKAKIKGCLKGSKVKMVQVRLGSKSQNKKFVKSYKKIFTKANAGKKVMVK
ncbi:MAG: hypothetical protein IJJ06_11400 [Mogibacterium sp.]|nr:hypothetical protein [Mogibacterium sp.]MBR0341324.1 hypothetical protein [Oscillospiraceae bacterium]